MSFNIRQCVVGCVVPSASKERIISSSRSKPSKQNIDFYNTLQCPVVIKRYNMGTEAIGFRHQSKMQ